MRTRDGHEFSIWAFLISVALSPFIIAGGSLAILATKMFPALTVILVMPSATLVLLLVPYIVVGWAALFFASQRRKPSILYWVVVGVFAGVISPVPIAIQNAVFAEQIDMVLLRTSVEIGFTMGLVMMPIWSGFAAILYWILTRGWSKDDSTA